MTPSSDDDFWHDEENWQDDELNFEWDDNKNQKNIKVHNISFEEATAIFYDENCIIDLDTRFDYYESRYQAIGKVNNALVLLVAHTYRDRDGEEVIRLISARPANKQEKQLYDYRSTYQKK